MPEPQTAAGKVLLHFLISSDGFVAGPGHTMDFMEQTTIREGLHQGGPAAGGNSTSRPPGRTTRASSAGPGRDRGDGQQPGSEGAVDASRLPFEA